VPSRHVDTGRDVYPSGPGEMCPYCSPPAEVVPAARYSRPGRDQALLAHTHTGNPIGR